MFQRSFDRSQPVANAGARRAAGFTLIELMVSVALLGVLAALAAPNMGQFLASRRVEDVARRLGDDLTLARNEAVKRNASVLVCADASVTTTACAATPLATEGAKGWRVCYDVAAGGTCSAGSTADPNPIRLQAAVNASVVLTGPAARLQFNPNGSMTSAVAVSFAASAVGRSTPLWTVNSAPSGAISVRKTG